VIEQNISVAEALVEHGIQGLPEQFPQESFRGETFARDTFPREPKAEARVEQRLAEFDAGEFAILNPGAGWGAKRWPVERYGEVARGLADIGVRSVLNYGPGEEGLVRSAEAASGGTARAVSCTLTELIALTRRARLFVGGDTGPLHLAAALHVPVVGIYGPTDPRRNGPYGTRSTVLRNADSVTSHARRAEADEGMLGIGSEAVVEAGRELIAGDARG
jgi:heptosyltransferase-1